jgi:hypothetical protein
MTDNQVFTAFQKKVKAMRFGHHVEIPFTTKVVVHVWTDKTDAKSRKEITFTMLAGMKAVDAGKMADGLVKAHFGLTRKEMEYSANFCSQIDILCAVTGKKLKV